MQLTTHDFLLGAIPGLEFLFRPSMAAASAPASGDGKDHFFYAQAIPDLRVIEGARLRVFCNMENTQLRLQNALHDH